MTLADMEQRGNELKHPTSASHWQFYSFFSSSTAKLPAQTVFVMSLHAWSFYPHPFNILLDLTVKWPPLIACLCLAMAAVASVLWTNIRGNYVEIKIYMKHCGCLGGNILTFDVALLMISVTFPTVCCHFFVHKAVFCFSFGLWGLWKERAWISKVW